MGVEWCLGLRYSGSTEVPVTSRILSNWRRSGSWGCAKCSPHRSAWDYGTMFLVPPKTTVTSRILSNQQMFKQLNNFCGREYIWKRRISLGKMCLPIVCSVK
jgi:hypothetical protein